MAWGRKRGWDPGRRYRSPGSQVSHSPCLCVLGLLDESLPGLGAEGPVAGPGTAGLVWAWGRVTRDGMQGGIQFLSVGSHLGLRVAAEGSGRRWDGLCLGKGYGKTESVPRHFFDAPFIIHKDFYQ